MPVLSKLTFENLKQNKRRTIFTIIGVALASALMLAVAGMVTSLHQTMINEVKDNIGDYHEIYENVPEEALKYIENNANVKSFDYEGELSFKEDVVAEFYENFPHSVYRKESISLNNDKIDKSRIFVHYKNAKEHEETRKQILEIINNETGVEVNYRTNTNLIQLEGGFSESTMRVLSIVAAIVIFIIIATSVFAIRNSFSISAMERMRQFGMLSSVGATKRQIRKSVMLEGTMVWIIAMPIGILLGFAATAILVMTVTLLIGESLSTEMVFSVPLWVFLVIILLSYITVVLSTLAPAIRAARISPVEAIRGNREIKIKPKKIRTSKLVRKLFGVGGVIADKNLKRAKRKYRTTVVSIVLSVATFIGLSTFMNQAFGGVELFYQHVEYDLAVSTENPEIFKEISDKFKIKQMSYYTNTRNEAMNGAVEILVTNEDYFKEFAKDLGVKDNFDEIAILQDYVFVNEGNKRVLKHSTDIKAGDFVDIKLTDGNRTEKVKIAAVAKKDPLGLELIEMPVLMVTENYAKNHNLELMPGNSDRPNYNMFADTDEPAEIIKYIEEKAKDDERYVSVFTENVSQSLKMMNNMYLLVAIFLYGFIAVITLIGMTNVFNTISANMALRSSEFASLKSIGMTTREFNRMIRLESLMYSLKALIIGVPLGLGLSWLFYKAMSSEFDLGYIFPIDSIIIAVLAVALLIFIVMKYSVSLVSKQNIIETIRSDTV